MAHDITIRFRCRALFEVLDMTLSAIAELETLGISTLSEWKNDDREEFGGIWIRGCKAGKVDEVSKQLIEELQATSVYDEIKNKISRYQGISDVGGMETDGILSIGSDNAQLQAQAELDITMLAAVQADYFDAQMFKNSMLSSIVLNNQVKKDISKVRQTDIKASSEIHKLAKEARFGKSPETMILNVNGDYTKQELSEMSLEDIEKLYFKEQQELIEVKEVIDNKENTQVNT